MTPARHISGEREKGVFFAEVMIPNKKGLHARASAQFVRCASNFTAQVRVTREGVPVDQLNELEWVRGEVGDSSAV